jgi:fumarate hydratase subunit alpha
MYRWVMGMIISERLLLDAFYKGLVKAVVEVPSDVRDAILRALEVEGREVARMHLRGFLENIDGAREKGVPVCADTGWPIFFLKIGDGVRLEGGLSSLYGIASRAVERATMEGYLRVTMVHPLSRVSSPTNIGSYIPHLEFKHVEGDHLDVTAIPKGGGAEFFVTTPLRNLLVADGVLGVKKFILDTVIDADREGKTCPPNIIGIGLGGFSDLAMRLAKQAALLRQVGDRHPEGEIAKLEEELLEAVNMTGIGPMGCGGSTTALDVHMEYAHSHTACTAVAVNLSCALHRRATVRLSSDGDMQFIVSPNWFRGDLP